MLSIMEMSHRSPEYEAINARANGADFDYIVPDQSILIENPAAVTKSASKQAKEQEDRS